MSSWSALISRLTAFASGGAAVAGVYAFTRYYKSNSSAPATPSSSVVATPWSDVSKYTKQPASFATGDTIFTFGSASNYFFACRRGSSFLWSTSHPISCSAANDLKHNAAKFYFVARTPHDDELVALKDARTDTSTWTFCFNPNRYGQAPGYESLLRWMQKNVSTDESSLMSTSVVFGPGAACFARTANACYRQDLPPRLEKELVEKQQSYEAKDAESEERNGWIPRIVALGAGQSFVAIWGDGRYVTSLHADCTLAQKFEQDSEIPLDCWENIVLSPYDGEHFFATTKLGHIYWGSNTSGFRYSAYTFMQMRARENNVTFHMGMTLSKGKGNLIETKITPDTDWTEEKLRARFEPTSLMTLYTSAVDSIRRITNM